jgi:electron transport complex protein RnfB
MSDHMTRRDALAKAARGAAALALGGAAFHLVQKAEGQIVWNVDPGKCINSRLGEIGVEVCGLCTTECVVSQSAVRAVNEFSKCGRCNICPAYFNVTSAVDELGCPARNLPARRHRAFIGEIDPGTRQ